MTNDHSDTHDFCRQAQYRDMTVLFIADKRGADAYGLSVTYPLDCGKLVTHQLKGEYPSRASALLAAEVDPEALLLELQA